MTPAASLDTRLRAAVTAWVAQDPDSDTREAAHDLVRRAEAGDATAAAELADAFDRPLTFGTAGLRGQLGPGPNRMNRVVVGQAAAGLAGYLLDHGHAGGTVIIGFDARHKSAVFARDTAEILAGAGFGAHLTDRPLPTPVVAFGVRHLGCVAGVVVTASHNPPQDNGYKVYLGEGCQIVPPADADIADRIAAVARRSLTQVPRAGGYRTIGDELIEAYLDRVATLVPDRAPRALRWVYTPLHGVGGAVVAAAVRRTGFAAGAVVAEQANPDPTFPTVNFPNPEEPGALDLALRDAASGDADLVVANDPDADRCAVAVPAQEGWRMLTGDELGALLAEDALRRGVRGTYACSVVSSSLLSVMAAAHGQRFVATLTGFKWVGRVPGLVFGYEEALGYCVDPAAVPDKDGVSALIRVLALAAGLKAQGSSLAAMLDEIARTYGLHATDQLAVRVADPELIGQAMARLRCRPPPCLLDQPVRVVDLATGTADLPPTDALMITGETVSVVVRPSGTEPKLKCYLEARVGIGPATSVDAARAEARSTLHRLRAEMSDALGV